jgi:hypothetical protein
VGGFETKRPAALDHSVTGRGGELPQHVGQVAEWIDPVPLATGRHAEQGGKSGH